MLADNWGGIQLDVWFVIFVIFWEVGLNHSFVLFRNKFNQSVGACVALDSSYGWVGLWSKCFPYGGGVIVGFICSPNEAGIVVGWFNTPPLNWCYEN